tara:strand:- start:79 stop:891 length:813 start_codon:yes stop_codon:yes gene_type:complete
MKWDRNGAESAIQGAIDYSMDFLEIALLDAPSVDPIHTRNLLEKNEIKAVCSLGLPEPVWPSKNPDDAIEFLKVVIDTTKEMGAEAVSGVTYGGIGERSGFPPTDTEISNVARCLEISANYAKSKGILFGIEPVNRYETHIINTAWQARELIERIGSDNIFIHLDTYHMNIEEKGAANGILAAREYLKYIHLSESDRGTPGEGCCDWDEIFATLAAINFKGGLAMESFINMPPEISYGLSIWRPVAKNFKEVMDKGLPFLKNKSQQYGLI